MTETQLEYIRLNSLLLPLLESEDPDEDDGECDRLRDKLDPLWYAMSVSEREACEAALEPLLKKYL